MYADLADPAAPFKLAGLLRNRHLDAFCLNDTDADAGVAAEQEALLAGSCVRCRDFLPAVPAVRRPVRAGAPRPARPGSCNPHPRLRRALAADRPIASIRRIP